MPLGNQPQLAFEHELRLESERVLRDLIFQRAPMQSRLLRYLMERSISGGKPPTQYEIAVDGLGKDTDYDVEQDSYPRVQISRLRRNLDNYYARNLPGNGLRIQIDQGSYRLSLEPIERGEAKNHSATPSIITGASGDPVSGSFPVGAAVLIIVGAVLLVVLGVYALNTPSVEANRPLIRPTTLLVVDADPSMIDGRLDASQVTPIRVVAERQLESSFVSSPLLRENEDPRPQYVVKLTVGIEGQKPLLFISLINDAGRVVYADRAIAWDKDGSFSSPELEAVLVYITSPTGIIAKEELRKVVEPESSDYACFLSVENRRAKGKEAATLVDRCLESFPESEYRAFWHARRAFAYYQEKALRREPITKSGYGWSELRTAFEADDFNAFANFVAAKIELSQGRCDSAKGYIDRALARGSSYPIMVAAVEANALACFDPATNVAVDKEKLRALAAFNPDPDPLLHSYLVLGLIATNDMDEASDLASRLVIETPEGQVEEMSQLFRRSLEDRTVARENRETLRKAVYSLTWNDKATDQIVDRIIG